MEVIFTWCDKRINSTKRPNEIDGYKVNINLKNPTSFFNPVFTVTNSEVDVRMYNYFYMPIAKTNSGDFLGAFYIEDIVAINSSTFEISGRIDVLATYRKEIILSSGYCERTTNKNLYNPRIIDEYQVAESAENVYTADGTESIFDNGDGCFILQTVNNQGNSTSSFTSTYIVDSDNIKIVANQLMTNQDLLTELKKWLSNPQEAVISCKWYPISIDVMGAQLSDGGTNIYLGNYDTGGKGYLLRHGTLTDGGTIEIPSNAIENGWRKSEPYYRLQMRLPYIGVIDLPTNNITEQIPYKNSVFWKLNCDVITGETIIAIYAGDSNVGTPVQIVNTNLSTAIAVASNQINTIGVVTSAIGGIVTSLANPIGAIGGAIGIANNFKNVYSVIGSNGGKAFVDFPTFPQLVIRIKKFSCSPDFGYGSVGMPCYNYVDLTSENTGEYYKFRNFNLMTSDLPITYDSVNEINNIANSGIWIE